MSTLLTRPQKYIVSFILYYCTFTYGCAFNFLSPTVIDFTNKFGAEISDITVVFTISKVSYLAGALICGILYKYSNRQLIVTCLLFCMAASLLTFPHTSSLTLFYIMGGLLGFASGGYDTAQTAWIVDIWLRDSPPFIFAQRFAYSLGTVLPPLLLGPFLSEDDEDIDLHVLSLSSSTQNPIEKFKLTLPFTIVGCLSGLAVLLQIILFFRLRSLSSAATSSTGAVSQGNESMKKNSMSSGDEDRKEMTDEYPKYSKFQIILLMILTCAAIAFFQGMEYTTMQFMPTFAVYSDLHLTKAEGAQILFGLSLAFCICRAIGILVVLKVPPHFILCGNFTCLIAGNLVLMIWAPDSKTMLWVGSVVMGIGLSTVYGCGYALVQQFLHVTDTKTAIITICGGLVAAIFPIIIGGAIKENAMILCHVNFVSIGLSGISFLILCWYTMCRRKK